MAQTQKVSRNNTTVVKSNNGIRVTLHSTDIFHKEGPKVKLNTGGYITATTVTRINQCANEFCNGAFHVSRAGGQMTVMFRGSDKTIPFDREVEFSI